MPISLALVTRFFQLLVSRRFAEAERELERLKQRMHETEWNRGYSRALYGMLIACKSNSDQYSFVSKLDFGDQKALRGYRREFLDHVKSKLQTDFDHGFFSAWAHCMRVLSKLAVNNREAKNALSEKEKPETVGKRKIQATIENFLKK